MYVTMRCSARRCELLCELQPRAIHVQCVHAIVAINADDDDDDDGPKTKQKTLVCLFSDGAQPGETGTQTGERACVAHLLPPLLSLISTRALRADLSLGACAAIFAQVHTMGLRQ